MRSALVVVALFACESPAPAPSPAPQPTHISVVSNIARADYIGPGACGSCHADELARWSSSLHRVMNAKAEDPSAVIGDFNSTLHYAGGNAMFTHDATGYAMTLNKTRYHVTRTIGRRGLQEYVGVEAGHSEEVRLPFGWWPRRAGWFPQPYFDPWLTEPDETGLSRRGSAAEWQRGVVDVYAPVKEPWAERCPWCHSTYPFEQRIARSSGPAKLGHGMEQMFTSAPGGERLAVDQQITTGISCESCHLGGRDHAAGGPIHFVPQGATSIAPMTTQPFSLERRDPDIVNMVCAQCHSGPSPRLADHTALRNSSEALDLAASPCRGIKCTDCHDPHRADSRADEARSIAACAHCHEAQTAPAHSGHKTASCLDCHMPRMVMGIDHMVRTHRISSPTDPEVMGEAGPNACNLCHLDRSISWTADELARGWEVKLPVADWARSYVLGLDAPVGEVWLASAQPAFRLLAAHSYARQKTKAMLPKLYDGLADPLAYMRVWTQFAVEDLLGRQLTLLEFDARAEPAVRAKQIAKLPH